ncbi:hypothetical protein EDC01DRAFT_754442 [Geopyxis carbonaria]|nr:hypothetical protein EDC01DRAFT_754442 [Geopyxis carbonaria]
MADAFFPAAAAQFHPPLALPGSGGGGGERGERGGGGTGGGGGGGERGTGGGGGRKAVFARLAQPFIGASRPPSSSGPPTSAPVQVVAVPVVFSYNLNSGILALSAHADGDRLVVAGREVLRILRVGETECSEVANLRLPGEQKRHFQYDVKWAPRPLTHVIATAGTNGTICLYDTESGKLDRALKEHGRQVHKLAFNYANGNLLLSASQDGTIKLWDLRERKSRLTFVGKADAARDVQFNTENAVEFAAAFDNGTIQRWDYRKENMPERKVNAHNGPVFTVDWHPDGKHVASGGRDRTVKVWDFYADPRRKPKHTITTIASVSRVSWRPSASKHTANQITELATCAFNADNRIQLWDLQRPHVPSRIVDAHDSPPTGLLWRDDEVLWSCSKDGTLVQHDLLFAPNPLASLSHSAFAWGPADEFTFATQKRTRSRSRRAGGRVTFEPSTDDDSLSLSLRDDRRRHSRSSSFKSAKPQLKLDSILDSALPRFVPAQAAARVAIHALFDEPAFHFCASHYIVDLSGAAGGVEVPLPAACERNARVAWRAQMFRTAQSWRILKLAIEAEDAAAARETQQREVAAGLSGNLVAWRALGLTAGETHSGGATPRPGPAATSPVSIPTPTPGRVDATTNHDDHLRLPPTQFGHSLSSSTISTDGDSSVSPSPANATADPRPRPTLSVDTAAAAHDFAPATAPTGGPPRTSSIDNDTTHLPLFTSSTEPDPPNPLDAPDPPSPPADDTPISPKSHAPATTASYTASSPSLARQYSLVSEQTTSSAPSLPAILEERERERERLPPSVGASTLLPPRPAYDGGDAGGAAAAEAPWRTATLAAKLLAHASESGDLQFAATLLLVLTPRVDFPAHTVDDVLSTYTSALSRARRPEVAALVRKVARMEDGIWGVDVDLSCGVNGKWMDGWGDMMGGYDGRAAA